MSEYVWCLHCEKVYSRADWRNHRGSCPNAACDGTFLDQWPWEDIRKHALEDKGVEYPKIPEVGKKYFMYPSAEPR
jgi:hypothetical protein